MNIRCENASKYKMWLKCGDVDCALYFARVAKNSLALHHVMEDQVMQHRNKVWTLLIVVILAALAAAPISAQDMTPSVTVSDQVIVNNMVMVESAVSSGPGFAVVHVDNGEGAPGPVIGYRWLNPGMNMNVAVPIDGSQATATMFVMLHEDTGEVGAYEFGTVEGADGPVSVDGAVVTPSFKAELIDATDQFVDGDSVTIRTVVTQQDGWLVIHAGDAASFGAVLGQTQITAGVNKDVVVSLAADGRTSVLWPMTHVDTGEVGTYEFGTVEGADGPVAINGAVATTPIWTVPHVRVAAQAVTLGDGMTMDGAPVVQVESVLAEGPSFLVIHQEADGSFGPVAGVSAPLAAGLTEDITIELDPAAVTPNLWPMLHVDDAAVGTYEFGTVEGADAPVAVDGNVVAFVISGAPSIDLAGSTLEGGVLTVPQAVIDAPGWLAIHSNNEGAPGPVIATYPLVRGVNSGIVIELDAAAAGDTVFPMLHYDTGEAGVYEFGTVEGADGPVAVGGNVVVGPVGAGAAAEEAPAETPEA
jgi:hypothetical protein